MNAPPCAAEVGQVTGQRGGRGVREGRYQHRHPNVTQRIVSVLIYLMRLFFNPFFTTFDGWYSESWTSNDLGDVGLMRCLFQCSECRAWRDEAQHVVYGMAQVLGQEPRWLVLLCQ